MNDSEKVFYELRPVEAYLLLAQHRIEHSDLFNYILIDLFWKEIIVPTRTKSNKGSLYVKLGKNIRSYVPVSYEILFLRPFQDNPKKALKFSYLVRHGIESSVSEKRLVRLIRKSPTSVDLYEASALKRLLGVLSLTKKGKEKVTLLKERLAFLEHHIDTKLERGAFPNLIEKYGRNVCLLRNIEFKEFALIKSYVTQEYDAYYDDTDD